MEPRFFSRPATIFIGAPVLAFLFPHLFLLTGGYFEWIMPVPREIGFVENASALFFLIAGVYAFVLARKDISRGIFLLRPALIFYGVLAILVALEEISYGQHFLHFSSPEWFLENNFNEEVNLHNLGADSISHAMRTGGYLIVSLFGIVAPLVVLYGSVNIPKGSVIQYFIPTAWMIVPSLFHLFANLPKNILKVLPDGPAMVDTAPYFAESGEYEEYMLGVWVILFVVSIHMAIAKNRTGSGGA